MQIHFTQFRIEKTFELHQLLSINILELLIQPYKAHINKLKN